MDARDSREGLFLSTGTNGYSVLRRTHEAKQDGDLVAVFKLADVLRKLLLEVGLSVRGTTESAHRNLEFPAATCAHCNDGSGTEPLCDFDIGLVRALCVDHESHSLTVSATRFNSNATSSQLPLVLAFHPTPSLCRVLQPRRPDPRLVSTSPKCSLTRYSWHSTAPTANTVQTATFETEFSVCLEPYIAAAGIPGVDSPIRATHNDRVAGQVERSLGSGEYLAFVTKLKCACLMMENE